MGDGEGVRVLIVGSPGTGKTTLSTQMELKGLCYRVSLTPKSGIHLSWDSSSQSMVVDTKLLEAQMIMSKLYEYHCIVIETHSPFILPDIIIPTHIVVLRTNPLLLYERLKRKGWAFSKILENVEAEYLGIPSSEAYKRYGHLLKEDRFLEIDTTDCLPGKVLELVEDFIYGVRRGALVGIDWTLSPMAEEIEKLLISH